MAKICLVRFIGMRDTPVHLVDTSIAIKSVDTSWHPRRKVWGYAFGDYYYAAKTDASSRGTETNYSGVAAHTNAFQFRRIYLGYIYDISKNFSANVLLTSEPVADPKPVGTTSLSNGDNLADNKMSFFIKIFDLKWRNIWPGTNLLIGEMLTPAFPLLTQQIWHYRSIERTVADFHRTNSYDVGASLQGTFDLKNRNFGYDLMIGNNSTSLLEPANGPKDGFLKGIYFDLFAKILNRRIILDVYTDYIRTADPSQLIGVQSHQMIKEFAAYSTPVFTFGLEAYQQLIKNGLSNSLTGDNENAHVRAFSIYVHGNIIADKLRFFARFDHYNPDRAFNPKVNYLINTDLPNYNPFSKENFYTTGLDFMPGPQIHFEPNIWLLQSIDQRNPQVSGYVPPGSILIVRLTFFYRFGQ